jgi:hypothetical protein
MAERLGPGHFNSVSECIEKASRNVDALRTSRMDWQAQLRIVIEDPDSERFCRVGNG